MVADKQLIIVVEGSMETSYYWQDIFTNYLEKIIKSFCGQEVQQSCDTDEGNSDFEILVIIFNALGSYAPLFQRILWTGRMDEILSSLPKIEFNEADLNDAPTGDAIAEALRTFDIPQNGYHTGGNLDGKRHCVLVASGNPFPYDRWIIQPDLDGSGDTYVCVSPEEVAGWFPQCSVSLSVICTGNFPRIRTLYQVAKRNPNAEDPLVRVHDSDFVVLISEDFKEALTALGATIPAPCHDALSPISSSPCQNALNQTGPTLDQKDLDPTNAAPHQNTLNSTSPNPYQNVSDPRSSVPNQDLDPTSPAPIQDGSSPTSHAPNQDALNSPIASPSQDALFPSAPAPPQEAVTPLHTEFEASTACQPDECIPTGKTLHESVGDISTQRLHNEPISATSLTESCLKPHRLSFLDADTTRKLRLQTISLPEFPEKVFCDIEDVQWTDDDIKESMLDTIFKYDICFSESLEITLTAFPDIARGSVGPESGTVTATSQAVKNQNESFMVSALIEDKIPITSELQPSSQLLDTISSMERAPASQIEDILGAKLQNTVWNRSQVVKNSNECSRSGLTTGTCQSVEKLNEYSRGVAFTEDKFQVATQHHPFGIPQSSHSFLGQVTSSHKDNSRANLDKTLLNMPPKFADDLISGSLNIRSRKTTSASKHRKKPHHRLKVSSIKGNIPSTTQKQFSSRLPETTPSISGQVTSHEDKASSLLHVPPKSQLHFVGSSSSVNLDETLPKTPFKFKAVEQRNGSSYLAPLVKTTLSQKVSSSLANTDYLKLWEGDLCGQKCGKTFFICRVEVFRMASASVMLAEDWPNSIGVPRLRRLEKLYHEFDVSRAVQLVFRVLTRRCFLKLLKDNGLGVIFDLPSQTLVLSVCDNITLLMGLLIPKVAPNSNVVSDKRLIASLQQSRTSNFDPSSC